MSSNIDTLRFEDRRKETFMYSFQTTQKLERLRQEAAINHALESIRQQHLDNFNNALKTLLLELSALTIGSLEISGKARVQKHV
jgi:hypothetical protein